MADYTVAFSELDALLQSLPANSLSNPYSVNVTGLTASDIGSSLTSGTFGYVLRNNATKFVDLSETLLPNSVTNMSYCFQRCTSLTTAPNIPNSVDNISYCFYGCTNLITAPNIPNSVTNIVSCFQGCTNLTTAPNIPNSVTNMYGCFYGCTSLTTAPNIPNSVTEMSNCFRGCTNLTTAPNIPNSVTNIISCFQGCTNLTTAPNIPNSVTFMGYCFYGCTSLTEVSILVPSGNLFTEYCFANTTQPIIVKTQNKNALEAKLYNPFPNNVTIQQELNWEIQFDNLNNFLSGCLQSPSSVYRLNVTGLQESDIGDSYLEGTLGYIIRNNNGVYADYSDTILPEVIDMRYCFTECTSLTTAPIIPNSVTDMSFCFAYCTSLTEAPIIPNSVTDMSFCFAECTSLTTAPVISNSVTDMNFCFYNCTSLTTAPVIPNSVTDMDSCFQGCTNLTTINNFQVDTENCDMTNCFSGCTNLSYIGVPETLPSATKWQFVHAIEDSDGITMTIETDDSEPVEVETSEHTYGIIGLICDMLFSADAFDSTRMSNYLASRMPWIVESPTSLDANEDWTVLWAKDPTKVKSNCFALKGEVGGGSSAPIGSIIASGTDLSNDGYILCDGRAVSRSDYAELFAKVGTTFGSGDGSTTFNVPDLRDKFIEGASSGIGNTGGEATHTLTVNEMPSHRHRIAQRQQWYGNDIIASDSPSAIFSWKSSEGGTTSKGYKNSETDIEATGGGQPHNNLPPYMKLYYYIKARNISQQEVQDAIDDTKTTASNVWSAEKVNNTFIKETSVSGSIATWGGNWKAVKQGSVITVTATNIGYSRNIPAGQQPVLFNLPAGYRPNSAIVAVGNDGSGGWSNASSIGYNIGTNGNVEVFTYQIVGAYGASFSVSYCV